MLTQKHRHSGFSLIELMIALAINGLLFASLITIFSNNLSHYRQQINTARLNQEMQVAMNLMATDIRRAGYWGNANSNLGTPANNNPFVATGMDLATNASGNCILFSYDHDANGMAASISSLTDDERYGFRLNGNTLQARPPGAVYDCSAAASAWENVTDTGLINITNLNFSINTTTITVGPGSKGLAIRNVVITMTGQLANDATVTKTMTNTIRVRNDKFIP